jgi:hypothetical protein
MDEPDESTPVSFKALKERWQKQESSVSPKSSENSCRQSPLNTPPKGTSGVAVTPTSKSPAPPVSKTPPRPAPENVNEPINKTSVPDAKRSFPVITPEILAKKGTPPPPPSVGLARPPKPKEDLDTNSQTAQKVEIDNTTSKRVSMLSQQFQGTSLQLPQPQRNGTFTLKSVATPKEAVFFSKQPKSQPEDIFERPAEAVHRHPSFDPRVDSGTFRTVMSPEQLVDKASDNSKPSPFEDGEEIDSDEEYEDSDEGEEEEEGGISEGYRVGSDSGFGGMHDSYSQSPKHTSVKQKRAPPPPPVSRRTRIAQLHQNPDASPLQSSQSSSQVQDTLRHIPVKPMLTDQPAKPPRLDAAATEKPPVSLDHNRSMYVLEQPAPLLPPRPNLANRALNDLEAMDSAFMSNARQSPKPLARARTIGAGSLEAAPPLPTRPIDSRASSISRSSTIHSSTDSRTPLGTSEGSASDQPSPGLRRNQTIARTERLLGAKIYPDHSNANRSPPYIHGSPLTVHHRGPVKLFAISGQHVITGTQSTRIYNTSTGINTATIDHTASNDINNRVCSMAFTPSLSFADEGRYLWLGMQDGAIMVVDVLNGDIIGKRTDVHSGPITNMLRYGNEEIWTIDDAGHMNAWPVIKGRGHTSHPLEIHPRREQVSGRLNFAIIVEQQLWMAAGRILDVYDIHLSGGSTNRAHTRVPNNVGNVTQLAAVPYHRGKVIVGHDDGKVTVWDTATLEITQTISLSIYGVSCMLAVGEYYLWAGYNTGMIYVYDTRPERWEVVKMWKAHGAQVIHMLLDETPLVKDNDLIQVASLDSNGTIQIWDGLLSDNWRGKEISSPDSFLRWLFHSLTFLAILPRSSHEQADEGIL